MIKEIYLLGNPKLYECSEPVKEGEDVSEIVKDLHDTLFDYRSRHQAGRAIAAPQIGVRKRIIYMYIDKPVVLMNPVLEFQQEEKTEVMDDCMSFPDLFVKVMRYKTCYVHYYDENWNFCTMTCQADLAELIQHEYDHLDGILATMRAVDDRSFFWNTRKL